MATAQKAGSRARASGEREPSDAPAPLLVITREQLLAANKPQVTKDVPLPGWATFVVGELRQDDKEEIDHLATVRIIGADGKEKEAQDMRFWKPRLIAAALLNADGSRMFPDWKEPTIIAQIAHLFTPAQAELLFAAVAEVNALTREAREALGKASPPIPLGSGT